MKEEVWRSIARVKIGRRIVILVQAQIVGVQAKIDIEAAVAIIIGQGGMRECAFRRACKLEGALF